MLAGQIETAGAGARGLVLLAGTLRPLCEVMADQLEALGGDMAEEAALARALSDMDEAQARQVTLLGVNGYYYWDEARRDREDAFVRGRPAHAGAPGRAGPAGICRPGFSALAGRLRRRIRIWT